ncbi:SGNH/GDSL hydrolase family protein [Paenibacillus sp. 843]|uniref:SGNH/GDSL hydrolase family protein n=1 Tax=Paenibacillus sp. 843 TaxID=3341795 RepID=UPI00372899CC
MKRILLLGDSIREGYEPYVRERLAGLAEVVAPGENGRFSFYTLWGVNLWMKELGTPDIVHWNNGLWDVHHEAPMVETLTPITDYVTHLKRIAHELQRTGAHIVFATTTPVHPESAGRSNEEIHAYNQAAIEALVPMGITIHDLNARVKEDLNGYLSYDRLHLNEKGYRMCADSVAEVLGRYL